MSNTCSTPKKLLINHCCFFIEKEGDITPVESGDVIEDINVSTEYIVRWMTLEFDSVN